MPAPTYYGQLQRRIAEERDEYTRVRPEPTPRCNYKPHTIECPSVGGHKIIETDTGKEFFVCSNHLGNYRAYNERANREVFVIVY